MEIDNDHNGLTIIKASAGSGKTHRLTYEYLKLVLSAPHRFKNILAVTFTNKATAEMKSRILQELQTIALTPSESKMAVALSKELNQSIDNLSQIAGNLVKSILHQYAFFNVSTIDHFFQNIIRNLTKELGLNGGFRIQLDQNEIIEAAVEKFIQDLQKNDDYMTTMLEYIDSQMDDEKTWNVSQHLVDFTKQLFREQVRFFYIKNDGSLNGNASTKKIKATLGEIINRFEKKTAQWVQTYNSLIEKANLNPEDFAGKTKNPLLSAKNKIEQKKYTEIDGPLQRIQKQNNWAHKDSENAHLVESLAPQFDLLTEELANIYGADLPKYIEATAIYKHIFQHALASGLMKKVSDILSEQNLFMLADAPVLLNIFTDGQDTPFIYEKSGRIFKHYMIDEFQDTSALQWENFKPLLEESLSLGNKGNFIVGDVKQAIYRWRNGDWTLLHKKVANQINQSSTETLKQNWRSKTNIVKFNNLFFKELIRTIGETLSEQKSLDLNEIYDDIEQEIPKEIINKRTGGYVFLKGIDQKKREEFIEDSLVELKKQVTKLKEDFIVDDICILVRKNDELLAVSEYLINETNYEVISSGSLTLGSSNLLQVIIACLRQLNAPHELYLKTISYLLNKNKDLNLHQLFKVQNNNQLPDDFHSLLQSLKQKSVLEIIEQLFNTIKINELFPNQEIFVARFYNEIKQVIFDKGSSLQTIIDWWESKGEQLSIELSEATSSGIKVMTIHKSKGLQFQHVIIPFAQWAPSSQQDTLWLPGSSFSLDETNGGIFPVNLNKNHSLCQGLSSFYEDENFAVQVDLINVLYVANTRAEDGLHIIYQKNPHSKKDISKYIELIFSRPNNLTEILNPIDENTFELGELTKSSKIEEKPRPKIKIAFNSNNTLTVKSTKQSIFGTELNENYAATLGSFWHKIFEKIIVKEDINSAINKQLDLGNLNYTQSKILERQIEKWLGNSEVSKWFGKDIKVLTEADIIIPKQTSRRPDRVVMHKTGTDIIDYKFGQQESKQHLKQVKDYCKLFKDMGYKNVTGYIWYPFLNKIKRIDSN